MELLEQININDYGIDLEAGKQSFYDPICSLGPVEQETLKTYL